MKITVQVVVDAGDGTDPVTYPGPVIERTDLTPATVGLHLDEAHQVLSAVQQHLVAAQAGQALATGQDWPVTDDLVKSGGKGVGAVVSAG